MIPIAILFSIVLTVMIYLCKRKKVIVDESYVQDKAQSESQIQILKDESTEFTPRPYEPDPVNLLPDISTPDLNCNRWKDIDILQVDEEIL